MPKIKSDAERAGEVYRNVLKQLIALDHTTGGDPKKEELIRNTRARLENIKANLLARYPGLDRNA